MSQPKNINDHLHQGAGPLRDVVAHANRIAELDKKLTGYLGEPLGSHCSLANIRGTLAVLLADSPAWSARLRYQLPQVLAFLNQQYPDAKLTRADVRVNRSS